MTGSEGRDARLHPSVHKERKQLPLDLPQFDHGPAAYGALPPSMTAGGYGMRPSVG